MKRAAIYARFSTDLQNSKSCEDQIALCREFAAREGLNVVKAFKDEARSGASMHNRPGLASMLELAKSKGFDFLIVEHADRLARSMGDLSYIHDGLRFVDIEIKTVHSGTLDTLSVGVLGLVGQMQREDGAKKVRRGMRGVIHSGRHAGGCAYGYRTIAGRKGELEIVPEEAAVVQSIFNDYAQGRPPREIAARLNKDGIAPPRGRYWIASTINGNAQRGNGLILNELYAGKLVWNKVRMVKDPSTGKRVSRSNPREEWLVKEAPHLRVVDDELWRQAQDVKAEKARVMSHMKRRPRHPLSGLLRCGVCGSGMSVHDHDEAGRTRLRCSTVRESGTCSNTSRIRLDRVEAAVFDGMRA